MMMFLIKVYIAPAIIAEITSQIKLPFSEESINLDYSQAEMAVAARHEP